MPQAKDVTNFTMYMYAQLERRKECHGDRYCCLIKSSCLQEKLQEKLSASYLYAFLIHWQHAHLVDKEKNMKQT